MKIRLIKANCNVDVLINLMQTSVCAARFDALMYIISETRFPLDALQTRHICLHIHIQPVVEPEGFVDATRASVGSERDVIRVSLHHLDTLSKVNVNDALDGCHVEARMYAPLHQLIMQYCVLPVCENKIAPKFHFFCQNQISKEQLE